MPSTKRRVTAKLDRFRGRHHKLDHVIRMVTHYGSVGGNAQAGAVTFFGFLSVFPILALAFFAVGMLAQVYPDLREDIIKLIENVLPGVVGSDDGEIPLSTFENYAATVGIVGLLVLLYSGLGWLSGMRVALETMFVLPTKEHPNFFVGKLRDLGTLLLLGLVLLVSVALSGLVAGFSERLLDWVGAIPMGWCPTLCCGCCRTGSPSLRPPCCCSPCSSSSRSRTFPGGRCSTARCSVRSASSCSRRRPTS